MVCRKVRGLRPPRQVGADAVGTSITAPKIREKDYGRVRGLAQPMRARHAVCLMKRINDRSSNHLTGATEPGPRNQARCAPSPRVTNKRQSGICVDDFNLNLRRLLSGTGADVVHVLSREERKEVAVRVQQGQFVRLSGVTRPLTQLPQLRALLRRTRDTSAASAGSRCF